MAYPVSEEKPTPADPVADGLSSGGTSKKPALAAQKGPPSTFRMLQDIGSSTFEDLNLAPMFWLVTPVFIVFVGLAAFLEFYVVGVAAHLGIFVIGSYMCFSAYFVANHYMMQLS